MTTASQTPPTLPARQRSLRRGPRWANRLAIGMALLFVLGPLLVLWVRMEIGAWHAARGQDAVWAGRWEEAIAHYDQALAWDVDQPLYYMLRSSANLELGRMDPALADAQRAYDLSAGRGGAAVFYATTLQRAGRPREAVDLYEEWLAQVGTDQEPLRALLANNIAMILATANMDLDRALERVQSALKHSQQRKHAPETLAYLDTRAMVYYRQGKFTEALADMNEVLRSPEQYKKTIEVEVANSSVDDRHRAYQLHREMHGLAQMLYHRALVHQALAAAAKNDADLRKAHLLAAALDRRRILELGYTPDASLF